MRVYPNTTSMLIVMTQHDSESHLDPPSVRICAARTKCLGLRNACRRGADGRHRRNANLRRGFDAQACSHFSMRYEAESLLRNGSEYFAQECIVYTLIAGMPIKH